MKEGDGVDTGRGRDVRTDTMDVALYTCGKVIIDDLSDTFEIHAPGHELCSYHDPAFAFAHSGNCVLPLLLGHTRVETVDIRNTVEDKLPGER